MDLYRCFSCPAEVPADLIFLCRESRDCEDWRGPMCLGCIAAHRLTWHHPSYLADRMVTELVQLASMEAGWQLCRQADAAIDSLNGRQDYLWRRTTEH